ncbi:MAG: 30S ribosomal protein S18 [Halobacteriovoraceae bacterium]|nr:30S ribosomal protein S18 [Halobacteriovoraceae bacterium]
MIYEMSVITRSSCNEKSLQSITKSIHEVIKEHGGNILIEDEWGAMNFAQSTSKGERQGIYLYFMFEGDGTANKELTRRFNLDENVVKSMIVKLGDERIKANMVKNYKTPFSKNYNGSLVDEETEQTGKQGVKRKFIKKKNCWFTAKGIRADWKDPKTFNWLVNEFGKISPARVTGISRKHQRFSILAIKRARQMGIMAYLSNGIATK